MNVNLDCIPCFVNSFYRLLETGILPEKEKEPGMRRFLTILAEEDYNQSPPSLARLLHRLMRDILANPDPYKDVKMKYNRMMLDLYPDFKKMVTKSENPFDTAMRLAMAGNVIDFGPQVQLNVMDTIYRVIKAELAIDDSLTLKKDIQSADLVLYIGDNCGEIVFDKLFIETIAHPNLYYAVRGYPVINDVTLEDAHQVGIDKVANIITTGDDAPGVVWETSSDEFKQIFNKADVIISKGQGNLEGLMRIRQNIYFLLLCKCDLIARNINVQTGDFVVMQRNSKKN